MKLTEQLANWGYYKIQVDIVHGKKGLPLYKSTIDLFQTVNDIHAKDVLIRILQEVNKC